MIWRGRNEPEGAPPPGQVPPPVPGADDGSVGGRVESVLDAAERAAAGIREDAQDWARRYLDEARHKADQVASERINEISALTDSLLARARAVAQQSDELIAALDDAGRRVMNNARPGARRPRPPGMEAPPQNAGNAMPPAPAAPPSPGGFAPQPPPGRRRPSHCPPAHSRAAARSRGPAAAAVPACVRAPPPQAAPPGPPPGPPGPPPGPPPAAPPAQTPPQAAPSPPPPAPPPAAPPPQPVGPPAAVLARLRGSEAARHPDGRRGQHPRRDRLAAARGVRRSTTRARSSTRSGSEPAAIAASTAI